jgi:hypothetical protein
MKMAIKAAVAIGVFSAAGAFGAEGAGTTQRDVNQQERIEQGLKSGELNTREAAHLEHQEAAVSHLQAKALKDGDISAAEHARLTAAQNRVSQNIYGQKHDGQTGNPNSASSQRMQADVQRNANQEARIQQGLSSGTLSEQEAARLERGQAHTQRKEARAGADGHVGKIEQGSIQRTDNRQSRRIFRKKHN